ncbi:hypothetical protein [Cupriavidus necator]
MNIITLTGEPQFDTAPWAAAARTAGVMIDPLVEPSSNQEVVGRMKIGYAIDTHASYVA